MTKIENGMKVYRTEDLIEKGKSLHIFSTQSPGDQNPHTHDFIEIVYVMKGSATQLLDGEELLVECGDMIFLNYGSIHSFRIHGEFHYVNICFSPEVAGSVITERNALSLLSLTAFNEMRHTSNCGKFSFVGRERSEIEGILSAMLKEYEEKKSAWHVVMGNYLNILLTKMLRKSELYSDGEENDEIWQEFAKFVDNNLEADLTLSDLASRCFYNPSYFSRIFKKRFQMSPFEYITTRRLQLAIKLLDETQDSIEEIAERAGFSDRGSFYRAFSKHVGMTPGEYRKTHRPR
jgi:AraC-like DNA-binding protein/mannose-6-phosphate isomerase-like protein (cupin superfamily)